MGGSPQVPNPSLGDTPRRRNVWLLWRVHRYLQIFVAPSRSKMVPGSSQKFLHRRHARTPCARDTPVAACMTKTESRSPIVKAGPSSYIYHPPSLARGPTGKAVLVFERRSRTLPYAPRACSVVAPMANLNMYLHVIKCVLRVSVAMGHRFRSILTHCDR